LYLKSISLSQFRNYQTQAFAFAPCGSLIIGPNGSGKTNLLEAIAYCGIGKSIRLHHDEQLLSFNATTFSIAAEFEQDLGLDLSVSFNYCNKKKLLKLDSVPIRHLSDLFNSVKVIYCAPEDLQLINGSPRVRRQYFDMAISQLYPEYISILRNYLHIVEQRNSLLKTQYLASEKRSWDLRFIEACMEVVKYREKYLKLLNEYFQKDYLHFSSKVFNTGIRYLSANKAMVEHSVNAEGYLSLLQSLEAREKLYQRSLVGAHIDDYEFVLDDNTLRIYGSQGQKRIVVILLKLIQATLVEQVTGIKPILLFDDIFAELDIENTTNIHRFIDKRYQVLIASPNASITEIWDSIPTQYLENNV
jgi:DNA replication and repair protein RecF